MKRRSEAEEKSKEKQKRKETAPLPFVDDEACVVADPAEEEAIGVDCE